MASIWARHPSFALLICLFKTMLYGAKLSIPILLFPSLGLPAGVAVFWVVGAFSLAGTRAGRGLTRPVPAFLLSFLGGFGGSVVFFSIVSPPANLGVAGMHALIAAWASWAAAVRRLARYTGTTIIRRTDQHVCPACGVDVKARARRCWSCRSPLARVI